MTVGDPVQIVCPGVVRLGMNHNLSNGRHSCNIVDIQIDFDTGGRGDAVEGVVNEMADIWARRIMPNVASTVTFTGGTYLDLDSLDGVSGIFGPSGTYTNVGAITGTPAISPQVSYLIHKKAGSHRGHRSGRMYVAGLAESEISDTGAVQASRITSWASALDLFRTDIAAIASIGTVSAAWRVVHVTKGDRDDPATWTWSSSTIEDAYCDPYVGTQRHRLR